MNSSSQVRHEMPLSSHWKFMVWNLLSMISGRLIVAVILFPQNAKFSINSSKTITLKITFHLKIHETGLDTGL